MGDVDPQLRYDAVEVLGCSKACGMRQVKLMRVTLWKSVFASFCCGSLSRWAMQRLHVKR